MIYFMKMGPIFCPKERHGTNEYEVDADAQNALLRLDNVVKNSLETGFFAIKLINIFGIRYRIH